MKRIVLLFVLIALALFVGDVAARETVGRGDFEFYLDTAVFRGRDGRVLAEVNVRIPNSEIEFKKTGAGMEARLKFSVLITDLDGKPVIEDAAEMNFMETDKKRVETSLFFQTIIKRYHIKPGVYLLSYAIEDLKAPKRTMVGRIQGKQKVSAVRRIRLNMPEIPPGTPAFSQARFVWDIGVERDGRNEYHPNPPRVYGLYKDTLMVYMELYLPDSLAQAPTFEFQSLIINMAGDEVKVTRIDLPNPLGGVGGDDGDAMRTYPILIREDLKRFAAGTYTLHVSFHRDGRRLSRIRAGNFSVAWDLRTWEVPRRLMLSEARFLLGDSKFESFLRQTTGDQEKMLGELWKSVDPTPETDVNEAYETFLSRLAFVNDHYADFGPGIDDPRGQLYIRLGAPDEIVQDVIPLNRETVIEAMQMIEDPYHAVSFSTHGVKLYHNSASRNEVIDPRGLGADRAGDSVGYPFELWVYHVSGEPIMSRDRVQEIGIGQRYLFVDRDGYGRYKLESSSSISTK